MCGVPVHSAESYLARLIKAGNRVAIAEQTESPAEARKARGSKALVDRAIVRLVTPGTLTEETLLEFGGRPTGSPRSAAPATTGRSPPPTFRPAGSSWSPAARASWRPSLRGLSPAETIADATRAGRPDHRRQGRVRQPGRRARAEDRASGSRRSTASARPRAPSWPRPAGCSPISTRPRKAPASCSTRRGGSPASSHMAIDAATRDSLELARSVGGSVAGSLLGEIDRCQTAAGRRLLCEDISAPLTDKPRSSAAGAGRMAARGCDPPRARAAGAESDARFRARAGPAGRGPRKPARPRAAPRRPRRRRRAARPSSKPSRTGRRCSTSCCRASAATTRWSTGCARRLVESPPIDASKGGYIAEGYDAALDALRDAASNGRRAIAALEGALSRRDRDRVAQDPPQCGARLSRRGFGQACRPADGAGQRLHPSPDARRRGPLQFARASRGSEPGDRGRRACARRRSRARRGADRARRRRRAAHHRHRRGDRPDRRRREPRPPRRRRRLVRAAAHRRSLPRDRSRAASGGRSRAPQQRRALRRQRSARSVPTTGCG